MKPTSGRKLKRVLLSALRQSWFGHFRPSTALGYAEQSGHNCFDGFDDSLLEQIYYISCFRINCYLLHIRSWIHSFTDNTILPMSRIRNKDPWARTPYCCHLHSPGKYSPSILWLTWAANFRSATYLLFVGHCTYDWGTSPKGREASDIVWMEHANEVLRELVALSDELFRFLTLPISTISRCVPLTWSTFTALSPNKNSTLLVRHKVTRWGRREAASTMLGSACGPGDNFVFVFIVGIVNIHIKV